MFMNINVKYQGRIAQTEDVEFINKLIKENPNDSRRELSKKLCRAWNWAQANGALRDMVCRGFMLRLESAGYIKLPPKKCNPNNPFVKRTRPSKIEVDETSLSASLSKIQTLEIKQVYHTNSEKLFNSLIEQYHYLGYCHPVGEHLKYIAYIDNKPAACFTWSSAVRHLGSRDKFIGWSPEIRKKNLHFIAYNSRFLILPWIKVKYLASHLLSKTSKIISHDWNEIYKHPIYLLETFVDTERFKGICYQAANWIYIGKTTGRGKNDKTNKVNRSIKAVWVYPLTKDFKNKMQYE